MNRNRGVAGNKGNDLKNSRKSKQQSSNSSSSPSSSLEKPSSSSRTNKNSTNTSPKSKKEDNKPSSSSSSGEKKRVSFSTVVEPNSSNVEKKNLEQPKRKLRDVGKLIISPPEPVGYLVVYSNAKKAVRSDVMTLWKLNDDKIGEENCLSEIRFGTDEQSNNVQIKRAINKDWPILENHCILTYLDNCTVLLLEEGALVLVNGVAYKNCDTDESDIINTNRVNISNGDIIDLDGRLLIYSKYNNQSYVQGYQEKFDEYIRERNKRKRETEEENEEQYSNKKTRIEDEEDEEEEDEDLEGEDDQEMIDIEEINNTLSEYTDEESEHSGNQELGGMDSDLTDKDFFSQCPRGDLKSNQTPPPPTPEETQLEEENVEVDPDFLDEIMQKLSAGTASKIEELETRLSTHEKKEHEFQETIKYLKIKLEEEVTKSKKLEELNKQIPQLEIKLSDKNEEIAEYKRSLEKTIQRVEKSEGFKKEYEKLKFKLTDMDSKLEEKDRLLEITLEEKRILKLSSENMRSQLSLLRKNSLLYEGLKELVQRNEKKSFWESFEAITKLVSETMSKSQSSAASSTGIESFKEKQQVVVDNDPTLILSADDIESSQLASPNNHNKSCTTKKPLQLTKNHPQQQQNSSCSTTQSKKITSIFVKPQSSSKTTTTTTIDTQELLDNMEDDYSGLLDDDYQDYENLSD